MENRISNETANIPSLSPTVNVWASGHAENYDSTVYSCSRAFTVIQFTQIFPIIVHSRAIVDCKYQQKENSRASAAIMSQLDRNDLVDRKLIEADELKA